ncbi:MAG TPA: hypothetical protein VFQ61_07550 [Polyangiaceae bacterium]|nr:hypothetical protein [Polyangiaceae bacterium]
MAERDELEQVTEGIAREFAARVPLRVLPPPVALEPIEIRQVWHTGGATVTQPCNSSVRS